MKIDPIGLGPRETDALDSLDDCIHVSYTEQAGGFVICDYCGKDVTFEIFPFVAPDAVRA